MKYIGIEFEVDFDFLPNGVPNQIRTFRDRDQAVEFAQEVGGKLTEAMIFEY